MLKDSTIKSILKYFKSKNVFIVSVNIKEVPELYVSLKGYIEGSTELDNILLEIYEFFWLLSYGTPNESNKTKEVSLKYKLL